MFPRSTFGSEGTQRLVSMTTSQLSHDTWLHLATLSIWNKEPRINRGVF